MSYINLNPGNCQACYRCIRECPVKSIEFKNDKATIIKNECILCGKCIENCPQKAKYIDSDIGKVKQLLKAGKKVFVSLAPSYRAWFNESYAEICDFFTNLGFFAVEETIIGASLVNRTYVDIMEKQSMDIMINSACPSVVMLIERYYPKLISFLTPVLSPMMTHAKMIKAIHPDTYVVFVGPCISKKSEPNDIFAQNLVDYVLTFDEVEKWYGEYKSVCPIDVSLSSNVLGVSDSSTRVYPRARGVIDSIENIAPNDIYLAVSVDGSKDCISMFDFLTDSIENDTLPEKKLFIEANFCKGSCMNGPIFKINNKNTVFASHMLSQKKNKRDNHPTKTSFYNTLNIERIYLDKNKPNIKPNKEQINEILSQMGKSKTEDELNCGACGYPTCRSKAEAVFNGKADIQMCLPFFRKKAENFSNVIINHSPNGLIVLDKNHMVLEINPTAADIFKVDQNEVVGGVIPDLYVDPSLDLALSSKNPIRETVKFSIKENDIHVDKIIVYIEEHETFLIFIKDISEDVLHKEQINTIKLNTANITQAVIEKQMRVVQEIASLLGETTAETKLALNSLKETIIND